MIPDWAHRLRKQYAGIERKAITYDVYLGRRRVAKLARLPRGEWRWCLLADTRHRGDEPSEEQAVFRIAEAMALIAPGQVTPGELGVR